MSRRRGRGPPTLRSASVTRGTRWWLCPAGDRRSLHRSRCERCGHGAGARPPAALSERDEQVSDLVGARPVAAQHDGAVGGERRRGHGASCGDVVGSNTFSLRADRGSACAGRRLLADPVALRAWLLVVIDPPASRAARTRSPRASLSSAHRIGTLDAVERTEVPDTLVVRTTRAPRRIVARVRPHTRAACPRR